MSRLFVGPALRTQSDRRLVTLVRDGYEVAFEEIVRRYGKALGRYAAAIVGARSEDVTQDAFSKALQAMRRQDGAEIELRPWLYRIVRNTALNDLRDRPPTADLLEEAVEGGSLSASEEAERREEITELMTRLRALPEPQRAAIVMRELEGLSHEEIAAALGMSGGAARQAIHRARTALRNGLGLMIPLPLLRLLIDHGTEVAGASAGGTAVAAGAATAGGVGAGGAIKLGAVAALVAGTVGTGLVVQHRNQQDRSASAANPPAREASSVAPAPPSPSSGAVSLSGGAEAGEGHHGNSDEEGDDRGGHGEFEPVDDSGGGRVPSGSPHFGGSDHGGRGPSGFHVPPGHGGPNPGQEGRGPGHGGGGSPGQDHSNSGQGFGQQQGQEDGSSRGPRGGGSSGHGSGSPPPPEMTFGSQGSGGGPGASGESGGGSSGGSGSGRSGPGGGPSSGSSSGDDDGAFEISP